MSNRTASMPAEEEGEFELVLGNRQLLGVFFLVVVLFGVFFTMGYIVGRNSKLPAATRAKEDVEAARRTFSTGTRPQEQEEASEPPSAKDNSEAIRSSPAATSDKESEREPPATSEPRVEQPQAGQTYLQVLAVAKPEAEVLVEVLSKKGFPALLAPGPTSQIFRVLVGPARNSQEVSQFKGELERAGFRQAFPKRY